MLLCLELAAVFDVVVAGQSPQAVFDRHRKSSDIGDDARQIATVDVAEDHDAPLNVLAVERVRAGRVDHVGHLAE